jgi:hypothetical protein
VLSYRRAGGVYANGRPARCTASDVKERTSIEPAQGICDSATTFLHSPTERLASNACSMRGSRPCGATPSPADSRTVTAMAVTARPRRMASARATLTSSTLKGDNRPENLALWTSHQPRGTSVADMLAWCWWFIDQYSDAPQWVTFPGGPVSENGAESAAGQDGTLYPAELHGPAR